MLFTEKNTKNLNTLNEFEISSALESENYQLHKFLGINRDPVSQELKVALWAPNALKVNLISDFNNWSPSAHPLKQHKDSGIWFCNLPKHLENFSYQFLVQDLNQEAKIINDPFSKQIKNAERFSSFYTSTSFEWQDQDWIAKREKNNIHEKNVLIKSIDINLLKEHKFDNFQALAKYIYDLALEEAVTHIELTNFFEGIIDISNSNGIALNKEAFLFNPANIYGEIDDFKCLINFLHKNDIGVILKLPYFSGELLSNYGAFKTLQKPIHENFYLSNLIYWIEEFHIDAINFSALEKILLRENCRFRSFFIKANQLINKRTKGCFTIAQESNCFNFITKINPNSLNFDFKLNLVFLKDFTNILRGESSNLDCFASNLLSENFLLGITQNFSLTALAENDLRIILAAIFLLPGKKFFLDDVLQEIFKRFTKLKEFYEDLTMLYESEKIYFENDHLKNRFTISEINKNILIFQRWNFDFSYLTINIINFGNTAKQNFQIEVPKSGFYEEIFNSSKYSHQSSLSNEDGVYTYSNKDSLSNKSIVLDIPAKSVLSYKLIIEK